MFVDSSSLSAVVIFLRTGFDTWQQIKTGERVSARSALKRVVGFIKFIRFLRFIKWRRKAARMESYSFTNFITLQTL